MIFYRFLIHCICRRNAKQVKSQLGKYLIIQYNIYVIFEYEIIM